jgi:DNA-binding NtrC family response regulator
MESIAITNMLLRLPSEEIIFGQTEAMRALRSKLERIAATNVPVLIQGESGTGKEIIARMIHSYSPWATGPFVRVNCLDFSGTFVKDELLGSKDEVAAGAKGANPVLLELPHRGTLFLDEIAELNPAFQGKLLQLFQEGQFCRVGPGARAAEKMEARMVCATSRNLQDEIKAGKFRPDLFFRINVLTLQLPALRERRADLPALVDYFLASYNEKFHCHAKPFSARSLRLLQEYHWPGNIRELENLMKRYVILGSEDAMSSELFPQEASAHVEVIPLDGSVSLKKVTRQAVRELERKVILRSLQVHNWNRKRVARSLGISYRALLYKIRDAGIGLQRPRVTTALAADTSLPPMDLDRAS